MAWADGTEEISNSADVIDSREVIARVKYLEEIPDTYARAYEPEEMEELTKLMALVRECTYAMDWEYGETLIRESYFQTYAEELAEDIGAVNRDASWPNNHIDWEAAAEELLIDYTSVDFDGVTYYIR